MSLNKKVIVYTDKEAFINRKKELNALMDWINRKPKEILFIYGPKSSGKTTLLMKFIEFNLNDKYYNIKHFNLRKVLVANYIDFIQAFFEVDYSTSPQEVKQKSEYSLKVFKLSKEIKQSLKEKTLDPFVVMEKELQKIVKKGIRPIIIIDELQALEEIYMNGQRELLKELFNFFVAMTKESHLCHVIIASSDGYFLKRIYEDSKLSKTSDFFAVEYLNEADIKYWLHNLDSESGITKYQLSDSQIDLIWKFIGGSMWEISNLLGKLIPCSKEKKISDEHLNKIIQKKVEENCARFKHYSGFSENRKKLLEKIYQYCAKENFFDHQDMKSLIKNKIYDENALSHELNRLVQLNYLTFDPTKTTWQLQGNIMFYGLQQFIKSIEVENGDTI
ncbi:ATP-binding protein [Candidatus Magnetomorum sp. HK-1]|nr:ATP-binding protein [Candidatus Magnetomorum sp. HK-1]